MKVIYAILIFLFFFYSQIRSSVYLQDQELNEAGFSKKKLFFKAIKDHEVGIQGTGVKSGSESQGWEVLVI